MRQEIPFGAWLPDQTDHKNPGLEVCRNAIPGPGGYRVARGPSPVSASLGVAGLYTAPDGEEPSLVLDFEDGVYAAAPDAVALSAAMYTRTAGQRVTVAATARDLFVVAGGVATPSGLGLSLGEPVAFQRFGGAVYATSKAGTWYLPDIETDTAFIEAAWTIPAGLAMARIGEFLIMGNLTDTEAPTDAPLRIRWSPFNNPAGEWATSIALQSDAVDMPADLGPVMGITGGASGLIFQRNGVSQIVYTGGASVFDKREIDLERGLAAPRSLAQVGDRVFYLSDDGFFVTEGTAGQPISRGRIWEWFLENAEGAHLDKVAAAVDWPNRCVVWTVPDDTGAAYALLYFNWETGNWSVVDLAPDCILASGRDGLSLEQVSAIYPNLDAMPVSLDSSEFVARGRSLAGFFGGELRQIEGETLSAEFETGEFQPAPGRRAFVREVTPIITDDAASALVTLRGRDDQRAALRSQADVALGAIGFAPTAFDARYFRVGIVLPAGAVWSDAAGFQIDMEITGHG